MGKFKEKNGKTMVGAFLQSVAPNIIDIVGDVLPSNGALGIVKNLIQKDDKLTANEKVEALRLLELDLENVKDARSMQKAALNQDDKFSKRFLYYLSTFWSVVAACYFFLATFSSVVNDKIADIILGFLLGSVVGVMMNFFYGDSHKVK
jgi:hypothetical protein|tara:strand:- start:834 stop:1280 length:447 start_codon:yes stop_codon:yes gene_type:complete